LLSAIHVVLRLPPSPTLSPYTTLFRSYRRLSRRGARRAASTPGAAHRAGGAGSAGGADRAGADAAGAARPVPAAAGRHRTAGGRGAAPARGAQPIGAGGGGAHRRSGGA